MAIDPTTNASVGSVAAANAAMGSIAVLTHHNDNSRTGANLNETILNTSNVKPQRFGKLFERQVDGHIYAQILYVSNVPIPNQGVHNVVYVATMHNSVYAFDADEKNASAPLWQVLLGPSVILPKPLIAGGASYHDISGEIGIISTPVISLEHKPIYVVALTKDPKKQDTDPSAYTHHLHALDLSTGQEKFGGPVQIQATIRGTGAGSTNGQLPFVSHRHNQRPALLFANQQIYIAFASFEDTRPYHGWLMAYDAATLKQTAVYNTTSNGNDGGIWQAGQGPAADAVVSSMS
jgi:hypothetical protein